MKIKPLFNQILIEPIEKKQVLVSDSPTLCEYGVVIDIGPDVTGVKTGDKIGFLIWGLNSLEAEGKKYYFVNEDPRFILGKMEE